MNDEQAKADLREAAVAGLGVAEAGVTRPCSSEARHPADVGAAMARDDERQKAHRPNEAEPRCERTDGHSCPHDSASHPRPDEARRSHEPLGALALLETWDENGGCAVCLLQAEHGLVSDGERYIECPVGVIARAIRQPEARRERATARPRWIADALLDAIEAYLSDQRTEVRQVAINTVERCIEDIASLPGGRCSATAGKWAAPAEASADEVGAACGPTRDVQQILRLVADGGWLVSSSRCSPQEIAWAQAEGRMYVDEDGLGYVVRPAASFPGPRLSSSEGER